MRYYKMNESLFYVDNPHVKKNVYLTMPAEDKPIPEYESVKDKLPVPVWAGHQSAIDCYYATWRMGWKNLRKPNKDAGFVSNFIDTAFNDYLFMWDSSFIVMFGKYASRYFDFQKTLDNLYSHQHRDGFICREICEYRNGEQWQRDDPASTGPNVLPWAEWEYYLSTGDKARIARVFDPLCAYHDWLRLNRSWQDGTYWSCGLACGMDNAPRQDKQYDDHCSHGFMSWIDTCAQQYLSASILVAMSEILGRESEAEEYKAEAAMLKSVINDKMWDEKNAFYYDTRRDGSTSGVKTVGSYWTLVAGLVPENRVQRFAAHLDNEKEFKRPGRIPSISADTEGYMPDGGYWHGGVWAPTNYMTLCGLHKYGLDDLAFEIARDFHNMVVKVFERTGTLYENYSPELKDGEFVRGEPAKDDFVGWTGLAPVSVLFEYVFGIHPDAQNKTVEWNINLTDAHGVKQYPLGDTTVELMCEARARVSDAPVIKLRSDKPITLKVNCNGKQIIYKNVTEIV